jgi:hypothetical protein
MAPKSIDVTLVAGCRPELLSQTLASFSERLFRHFNIAGVVANIDPVFGGPDEARACRKLILTRFPEAEIHQPESASFGGAVKRVWGRTTSDLVFHLEDDWLLNAEVGPENILPRFVEHTRAVVLVAKEHGWNGRDTFNVRRRKVRFLGIPVGRRHVNVFSTSPQFLDGGFARGCAELMDPALDPEKQMRPPHNPALRAYMRSYRSQLLPTASGSEMITDIGRAWRENRRIRKTVGDGISTWTTDS